MNPNILLIPRGLTGIAPLSIDLTSINITEARIAEIASVTPTKAPDLLAAFNRAYLDASSVVNALEMELVNARRTLDKIRSVIILDRVPKILHEKGLATSKSPAGSEDLRKAIIEGDEEYQNALGTADIIHSYLSLLKSKAKGIEMAFSSVKRILQEQAFNYASPIGNKPLSAGGEPLTFKEEPLVGAVPPRTVTGFASKNKY